MATAELLVEVLNLLSPEDFEEFKTLIRAERSSVPTPSSLEAANVEYVVELMVKTDGGGGVEAIEAVLMKMNRSDLVQRLTATDSGAKDEVGVDEEPSSLDQTIRKLSSDIQLVLDSLEDLSDHELQVFKDSLIRSCRWNLFSKKRRRLQQTTDPEETVIFIAQTFGGRSWVVTREVLEDIGRSDLAQESFHSDVTFREMLRERTPSLLPHKAATMAAVKQLLLEVLDQLSDTEFLGEFKGSLSDFSPRLKFTPKRTKFIEEMMEKLGRRSVDTMKELLIKINRKDLAEILLETGESSNDGVVFMKQKIPMSDVHQNLSEILRTLDKKDLGKFKSYLQFTCFDWNLPKLSDARLKKVTTAQSLVDLMAEAFGQRSGEMAKEVLRNMNKRQIKSGEKSSGIVQLKKGERVKDSSSWTKFKPEVKTGDPVEPPTYSLQCEAGRFECSVSGLRWVCSGKAAFSYRFCSWDRHMDRMESRGFRPAGPLMDISLISGEMKEVFLPHWICIEDIPEPLEQFAVLHMDDCGDAVEKASEVSSSHVKLAEHIFSPRPVLMKVGFPVKIRCNTLIYRTNTAFLTLHVYLVPQDPALQQEMDRKKTAEGCKVIEKPNPERSLKMSDYFFLTSDLDAAEVCPKTGIKLRYPRGKPNFFEVYVKNADRNFSLMLRPDREDQAVWECAVRRDEYQSSGKARELQCVDGNLSAMMQRAATITSDKEMLLKLMKDLKQEELKEFKWFLKNRDVSSGLPEIPASSVDEADAPDLVDLMMKAYTQRAVDVTRDLFKRINRNDLVEKVPDTSS